MSHVLYYQWNLNHWFIGMKPFEELGHWLLRKLLHDLLMVYYLIVTDVKIETKASKICVQGGVQWRLHEMVDDTRLCHNQWFQQLNLLPKWCCINFFGKSQSIEWKLSNHLCGNLAHVAILHKFFHHRHIECSCALAHPSRLSTLEHCYCYGSGKCTPNPIRSQPSMKCLKNDIWIVVAYRKMLLAFYMLLLRDSIV